MAPQSPSKKAPWNLTRSLIFVDCSIYAFNLFRCPVYCWLSRTWISFNKFLIIFEVFVPHFICAALIGLSPEVFWIIWVVSIEKCSSLTQNVMQIRCSTCSVILNVTTTQYTCSLNGVYWAHGLAQWSWHSSRMHIPVHTPWLPGYIYVTQTILVMLKMAELFQDQPCIIDYDSVIINLEFTVLK